MTDERGGPLGPIDVFELADIGMALLDQAGRLRRVNPAFVRLVGRPAEELHGSSVDHVFSIDDRRDDACGASGGAGNGTDPLRLERIRPSDPAHETRLEVRCDRPDGTTRRAVLAVWPLSAAHGGVIGFLAQARELSEVTSSSASERPTHARGGATRRRQAGTTLERGGAGGRGNGNGSGAAASVAGATRDGLPRSGEDGLTGLADRASFLSSLENELDRAAATGHSVALILVGLDDFAATNERLDERAGDEILLEVARRLRSLARSGDLVGRIGGDQFALALVSARAHTAGRRLADRILGALRPPVELGTATARADASIGIASGRGGEAMVSLLHGADVAMHLAKREGKGRVEVAWHVGRADARRRLLTVSDLDEALEGGEFTLYYQPIVASDGLRPAGVEALTRWRHPRHGLIGPAEFIPLAEAAHLVGDLDAWVLAQTCRQVLAWREEGVVDADFFVSVNLSPRQLGDPALVDYVSATLDSTGLDPRALVLEVTDAMRRPGGDEAVRRLASIRRSGVRIALDHYGNSTSSPRPLLELPIDIVKLDKSLVEQAFDHSRRMLVQTVVELIDSRGVETVADGIDRQAQVGAMRAMGCRYLQGNLLAAPSPPSETGRSLRLLAAHGGAFRSQRRALLGGVPASERGEVDPL